MSRSTLHDQLYLNDGSGKNQPIQTGTFVTKAIMMDERRRLSLTIGVLNATGYNIGTGTIYGGGFTGTLLVQGTDEIGNSYNATGTPWASSGQQPGQNGYTGALFWNTIPSGSIAITNATTSQLVTFTDVGPAWIRVAFNQSATGTTATGTLGGSGTMQLFITAKHT